ncbi:hypothetical protein FNV43_RR00248 [Rhamnella rubrinervis]|uniref:Uncharacterized protein n=1 Tax=Rhamnella rubrinervis TaxID=2594499 RepID=A0A8K0HMJ1_9ROSA|nr:hypothetical protein FNV43_RR00248 [Rhamnella rubrinervis]
MEKDGTTWINIRKAAKASEDNAGLKTKPIAAHGRSHPPKSSLGTSSAQANVHSGHVEEAENDGGGTDGKCGTKIPTNGGTKNVEQQEESFEFNEDVVTMSALDAQMRRSFRTWRSYRKSATFRGIGVIPKPNKLQASLEFAGLRKELEEYKRREKETTLLILNRRKINSLEVRLAEMEKKVDLEKLNWKVCLLDVEPTLCRYCE